MLKMMDDLTETEFGDSGHTSNKNTIMDERLRVLLYEYKPQEFNPKHDSKETRVESILSEYRDKKIETYNSYVDSDALKVKQDALSPEELTTQLREVQAEVRELKAMINDITIGDKTEVQPELKKPVKKKRKKFAWVFDVLFYLLIIAIVLGAVLIRSSSGGKPFLFAGYSAFTVLTSSMEDVIPKGSLVITKSVDANTLQIGDDITFMSGPTSTITHRIVGIEEKYGDTGERAFKTKGTMNKQEDDWIPAVNVVGKVIYHNKAIGDMANFIKINWPFILFVVIVLVVLFYVLERIFREDSPEKTTKKHTEKSYFENQPKQNKTLPRF